MVLHYRPYVPDEVDGLGEQRGYGLLTHGQGVDVHDYSLEAEQLLRGQMHLLLGKALLEGQTLLLRSQ